MMMMMICRNADLVKEVKFRPRHSDVAVGDEIKCHARGNPTPRIVIEPAMTSEVEGPGWKSFRVPALYEGRDMKVACSATNSIGDDSETTRINRTFHVAGQPCSRRYLLTCLFNDSL